MKKKILTTIILIILCTLAFCQCVKAEAEIKTTIQIKWSDKYWDNISASDAYDKCQELNDDNSALGITGDNVMAHLSTNADWYAVSLLAMSSYGGSVNNGSSTGGNDSGVLGIGSLRFTAGIIESNMETTNKYYQSIIDNKDTKFVEKLKQNQDQNKAGLGFRSSEILISSINWYHAYNVNNPISLKRDLVGFIVGKTGYAGIDGKPSDNISFRPVIWVK